MIYDKILHNPGRLFSLLIDPENYSSKAMRQLVQQADEAGVDFILIGGSLLSGGLDRSIQLIKEETDIPVLLFPGSLMQVSSLADGILFLSLISGRNPELLIGNHVLSAKMIQSSGLEVIPTGYILVNGGNVSSVEYISNTRPIPLEKTDIITSTALAGELLGHRLIYLESGSGASRAIYPQVIRDVKKHVTLPLVVGGGLKTPQDVSTVCQAGADVVVVGNAFEDDPSRLNDMVAAIHH